MGLDGVGLRVGGSEWPRPEGQRIDREHGPDTLSERACFRTIWGSASADLPGFQGDDMGLKFFGIQIFYLLYTSYGAVRNCVRRRPL